MEQNLGAVEYRSIDTITRWSRNPRSVDVDANTLDMLSVSLTERGWLDTDPAIVLPGGELVQGNVRYGVLLGLSEDDLTRACPDRTIPVRVWTGTEDAAVLYALSDIGTGTTEKQLYDLEHGIVGVYQRNPGWGRTAMIDYLYVSAREVLYRLSPACKAADTMPRRKEIAGGKFEALAEVAKLPGELVARWFDERKDGAAKHKVFSRENVKKMLAQASATDAVALADKLAAEIAAGPKDSDKAENFISAKSFINNKLQYKSATLATLADLMTRPGAPVEGQPDKRARDAAGLLAAIDAALAERGA
jgi:hypothetical protein